MLNNYFSSKSYTVLVMGILEGATMEMENLVKEKRHGSRYKRDFTRKSWISSAITAHQ